MKKKILEMEKLSFSYEESEVLRNINFSVESGEFIGIIGSNGAGKSTLLKLILGLISPTSGKILFCGEEIKKFKKWPKIGYVAQNAISSNDSFPATVEEIVKSNLYLQIGFMRLAKKKHIKQTMDALKMIDMQDYAKRLIGNLSGGQQQRIMIARALVNEPELLILDEPTTGIDDKSIESLYNLLNKINLELGITIIMVTHDIHRICGCVGRILSVEDKDVREISANGKLKGDFKISKYFSSQNTRSSFQ